MANKLLGYNDIGYLAATFEVDETTKTYLKEKHTNPSTGKIDINGKNLCVKLGTDGKVGFGASAPTSADALLGVIIAYEMDGYASVQVRGGREEVPTSAAITCGRSNLAVNNKGELVVVDGARPTEVVQPSTSDSKFATVLL